MRSFFIRVLALAHKEVIHIRRDITTLYMALGMPVVLLLLFGFGVSFDVGQVPLALVDHDRSALSQEVRELLVASGDFRLVAELTDVEEVTTLFRRNLVLGLVVIPQGFEAQVARGAGAVQFIVDGADANTANQVVAYAETTAMHIALELTPAGLAVAGGEDLGRVVPHQWMRFNPEGRSALFLVPGLIAYILAIVAVLLTALTVAREWERGSMEQLFSTPVGRVEIVVGKLLPYLAIGAIAVMLVLAVGAWVFDVPLRGSLAFLALAALLFLVGMLGLGLLISVVTRNQMVATQAAAMASVLPTMLLSDFIFPIENMPWLLQLISHIIPARYFIECLRGVLLRGNGFAELWPQTVALAVYALATILMATLRFRRRLA